MKSKSIRFKLFMVIAISSLLVILLLVIANNTVLESYYIYSKEKQLKEVYQQVNDYYNTLNFTYDLERELERISVRNNFDILIKGLSDETIYTSNNDFFATFYQLGISGRTGESKERIIDQDSKTRITKIQDYRNNMTYVLLSGKLDNGYNLYMRISTNSIQESVRISNRLLYIIAAITVVIAGSIAVIISRKSTNSILELNDIAEKMSNLDFSKKYDVKETDDEINNLGKSVNKMSDKLKQTIKTLQETNLELEKDVEEKSKINEMRTRFISDVSHELKTPIALIQGYSEGLIENVSTSDEDRKFYAEVILDESNKMDKLVKQLLELMKLEYGKREFNNTTFDIIELEKEVVRKSKVMLEENNIEVKFEGRKKANVIADDFYIEQVITNYLTNAIKHAKEENGEKIIKITNKVIKKEDKKESKKTNSKADNKANGEESKRANKKNNGTSKLRVSVYNTGDKLEDEQLLRVWNRFYKADESRHREDGGVGIGLSLVKAIMNNYENAYGVENKENGVEFFFELNLPTSKE